MDLGSSQQLNELIGKEKDEYEAKIKTLQAKLATQDEKAQAAQRQQLNRNTQVATQHIVLDEALTRILIDQQLTEAGWQADSEELTFKHGARPEKGKNLAIAEWPTEHQGKRGRADYVLFAGLTPIAVVEAKKENTNVAGKIPQAERYSKGLSVTPPLIGAWEQAGQTIAWPDEEDSHYKVPFVYSCNGRPYVPQLAEQSGTWFRDVRPRPIPNGRYPASIRQRAYLICSNAVKKPLNKSLSTSPSAT